MDGLITLIVTVAHILAILVPLLIGVAMLTWAERRVLGAMQLRKGPNVVGPFGMLQPFADAIKMLMKETIIPAGASRALFVMAPMLASSTCSRSAAWASTASSSRAGRPTRNTPSSARCGRRRRWCPTKCRWASSS
jgi:NADH:ubiquinone oxidoreductase subunit H